MKKLKTISVGDHKKAHDIATIAAYGIGWAEGTEDRSYELGGIETVAHQISCCLYQWFRPRIELDTAETRDHFNLEKFPKQEAIESDLVALIKESKQKGK